MPSRCSESRGGPSCGRMPIESQVHATRMVETPVTLWDEQNEPIDPIHGMFSFVPLRLVLEQTLKERL